LLEDVLPRFRTAKTQRLGYIPPGMGSTPANSLGLIQADGIVGAVMRPGPTLRLMGRNLSGWRAPL
jgi:hypothetical protein